MEELETARLRFKQIEREDLSSLLSIYNKEQNMRFISNGKYNWTVEELDDRYKKYNIDIESRVGVFAIILKQTNTLIGEVGVFNSFNSNTKLELGYILNSTYWGRGLGFETCEALITYCFNNLKAEILIARMYSDNVASVELAKRCNMYRIEQGVAENGKRYFIYELKKK